MWWTEARASTAVAEGGRLAGSFAGRLATVLGGTVWPPEAASTDVVPLTTDIAAPRRAAHRQARPAAHHRQRRATRTAAATRRTQRSSSPAATHHPPPTAPADRHPTTPRRTALLGHPNRWSTQDPDHGFYDGLSGAVLHWKGGTFTPVLDENGTASVAAAFTASPQHRRTPAILSLRTLHPADKDLILGRALETAWQHLTGTPPAGWNSSAEPVNLPWSTRQLTDLARGRAPQPTWLIAVGHPDRPVIATVRITRTPAGA